MRRTRKLSGVGFAAMAMAMALLGPSTSRAAFDVRLYLDIPGDALLDIQPVLDEPDFPDNPDIVDFHFSAPGFFTDEVTSLNTSGFFEWPQENGVIGTPRADSGFDFFGLAASGILYVPETGMYRFYVASNNESALYFNPTGPEFFDLKAGEVAPIASEDDISDGYEPDPAAPETSDEFFLETGKGYAMEMILTDRTGQDWFQVGWSYNGGAAQTIPAYYIQRDVRFGAASANGITSQDDDVFPVGPEGAPLIAQIGVSFEKPAMDHASTTFAWEVDAGDGFEPIEDVFTEDQLTRVTGLNSPALSFSALSPAWDLYVFRPIVDGEPGHETELEVDQDESSPAVAGARGAAFPGGIQVDFTEEVNSVVAVDRSNYRFMPERTINGITLAPGGRSVRIDIGVFTNEPLELTVSGIPDRALDANVMEEQTVVVDLNPFGVLAHWTFDNDSTVDSIGGLVGTLERGATFSDETPLDGGQSLDLGDASGGQLLRVSSAGEMLNAAAGGDSITFSYWQKLDTIVNSSAFWAVSPSSNNAQRGAQVHSPWNDRQIYFDTGGCCDGQTQRINAPIGSLDAPNFSFLEWHHFAFVKGGANKSIWVDGVLLHQGQNTAPLPQDFTELVIGAQHTGANSLRGRIDDFAVFDVALSPEEIAALANQTNTPGSLVAPDFGELTIAEDLVPATVTENRVATFTFVPAGTPLEHTETRWAVNGEVVPGETGRVFEFPAVLADDGATVVAMAANANGAFNELVSSEVFLTVVPDTEAPRIVEAGGAPLNDRLTITFSEKMAHGPLANPANYSLAPTRDGESIAGIAANASADGLRVEVIFETPMQGGTGYTMRTENLTDTASAPNPLSPATFDIVSYELAPGGLTVLLYKPFPSGRLLSLGEDEPGTFPEGFRPFGGAGENMPDLQAGFSTRTPYFESPASGDINLNPGSVGDSYAQIVFGFLRPLETGDYRFFLATDDEGQLWLSDSDDPADAELIATEPDRNGVREYDDGTKEDNWSDPIPLEAGALYYVEARMSEGSGGDNLAVAWSFSNDGEDPPVPPNGSAPISSEFLLSYVPTVRETKIFAVPAIDSTGVPVDLGTFWVTLSEGTFFSIDPETVTATVNGEPVDVAVTVGGGETEVRGVMPLLPANTQVPVVLTYETTDGEIQRLEYAFTTEDIPTLDPTWAVGLDEGTERGFNVRSVQWNVSRGNDTASAETQLATSAGDERILFQSADDLVFEVINFNRDVDSDGGKGVFRGGSPVEAREIADTNFAEVGLIDPDGNSDNFSIEATAYLAFAEPGIYTMGVNSDDGFRVTSGLFPTVEDSALELGVFSGSRGAPNDVFQSTFRMVVPKPGLYPFRFIGYQGIGGASMEWYSIDEGETAYLINDDAGILAFVGRTPDSGTEDDPEITSIVADGAGTVTLEYTGRLQSAPAVTGPYTDVAGASSPYTFTPAENLFMRVQ